MNTRKYPRTMQDDENVTDVALVLASVAAVAAAVMAMIRWGLV